MDPIVITDPPADPAVEIDPPAADPTPTDPPADPPADPKEKNREGYEARQAKKVAEDLRKELEGYKRREEDARKAKLTTEQALKEERDSLAQENTRLKQQGLQSKIAAEFKLPSALAARLIGSDEESLRADAAELAAMLPKAKVGTPTDPLREQNGKRVYKRSELRADPVLARSPEVRQAAMEGRVTND